MDATCLCTAAEPSIECAITQASGSNTTSCAGSKAIGAGGSRNCSSGSQCSPHRQLRSLCQLFRRGPPIRSRRVSLPACRTQSSTWCVHILNCFCMWTPNGPVLLGCTVCTAVRLTDLLCWREFGTGMVATWRISNGRPRRFRLVPPDALFFCAAAELGSQQ